MHVAWSPAFGYYRLMNDQLPAIAVSQRLTAQRASCDVRCPPDTMPEGQNPGVWFEEVRTAFDPLLMDTAYACAELGDGLQRLTIVAHDELPPNSDAYRRMGWPMDVALVDNQGRAHYANHQPRAGRSPTWFLKATPDLLALICRLRSALHELLPTRDVCWLREMPDVPLIIDWLRQTPADDGGGWWGRVQFMNPERGNPQAPRIAWERIALPPARWEDFELPAVCRVRVDHEDRRFLCFSQLEVPIE